VTTTPRPRISTACWIGGWEAALDRAREAVDLDRERAPVDFGLAREAVDFVRAPVLLRVVDRLRADCLLGCGMVGFPLLESTAANLSQRFRLENRAPVV
jgi:hypothetical protein